MPWTLKFKDNGVGSFYSEIVTNPAGYAADKLVSDGVVINIYYSVAPLAPAGNVAWNLGIRNTGRLPDRSIVVNVIVATSVKGTDLPTVRDGSGGGPGPRKR